jgi:phage FluMu protein Com
MQIRCKNCRMPISIGRQMVDQALNIMYEENLVHFDFRCPKCKKTNKASQEQLLRAAPGWEYKPAKKIADKQKADQKPAAELPDKEKPAPKKTPKSKGDPKTKPAPKSKTEKKPAPKPKKDAKE